MIFFEHPWVGALVWVGASVVSGFLGYIQGRKDEELRWRRIFDGADTAHDAVRKAIGFRGRR